MTLQLTEDQQMVFEAVKKFFSDDENPAIVIMGSAGTGKCLGENTPVIMHDGTIKMVQDIHQGELVMGDDSTPRTVLSTTSGEDEMFRITTNKKDSYEVNSAHILTFQTSKVIKWIKAKNRFNVLYGHKDGNVKCKSFITRIEAETFVHTLPAIVDIPLTECIEKNKKRSWQQYFKGVYTGLDFPQKDCEYDPYFIGLWLGDVTSKESSITNIDPEIIIYLENKLGEYGMYLDKITYRFNQLKRTNKSPFVVFLKQTKMYGNKHIPYIYLINSEENRLKLLAGLLDSDGSLTSNCYEIVQKNKRLAYDIYFLAKSLGFQTSIVPCVKWCMYKGEKKYGTYYRMHISGNTDRIPVLIQRKKASPRKQIKNHLVSRINIEPIGKGKYYGFVLDGNHRFVLGNFIITHNTTITKYIVDYIMDNQFLSIVAIAPTHKARRVLEKKLNQDRFIPVPSLTVASILGKMREHSYIGSHNYTNGSKQKMDKYDCFIIDEISMVSDKDLDEIINYICEHDKRLILIGDNCQIPAPSQQLVKKDSICYKPDSYAFEIANKCVLTDIVRQAADSPIIKIASYIRDHIMDDIDLLDILHACDMDEKEICCDAKDLYSLFQEDHKNNLDVRVIAYTNAAVRMHNTQIRKDLGYDSMLVEGELLTGYGNLGWPTPVVENGTDYRVALIRPTNNFTISGFGGLVGNLVDLVDLDDNTHISRGLFFIEVKHSNNARFMQELVTRAEKVNQRYSTKNDYKKYCALKNKAVFIEDVYKHGSSIFTETNLRQSHPLLFTKISDVIDTTNKTISVSELTAKLEDQYGELVECRLIDNKPFADAEVFADQYMVVEKDIYYGYSITAHKSQGSTYDSVYVDEYDFKKISNKWNYKLRAVEQRHKERNQLKYVAYTRASKNLRIVT